MVEIKDLRGKKAKIYGLILIMSIIAWSIFLIYVSPSEIIDFIGIENGYVLVFISGLAGGISLFFPFPYYLFVLTFGAAGLNPYFLAIAATLGVVIGECTSYFVGHSAHFLISKTTSEKLHKLRDWAIRKPKFLISMILFIWASIAPIPNDFFLVPFGVIRYPFLRIIIPLALGSLVFNTLLAITGNYGLGIFLINS